MESELVVFEESLGSYDDAKSAYGLIYISDDIAKQSFSLPTFNSNINTFFPIPDVMKKEVMQENMKFNEEVHSYQINKIMKKINDKFKAREQIIINVHATHSNMMQIDLINILTYLSNTK